MSDADEFSRETLARFQNTLLEILADAEDPKTVVLALQNDPRLMPFREFTECYDPKMIELAMLLTRKWSVRTSVRSTTDG